MDIPENGIMKFESKSCAICKITDKTLESVSDRIQKIDVNKDINLSQYFGIMSLPTFVFIKDGREKHRFSGMLNLKAFNKKLKALKM